MCIVGDDYCSMVLFVWSLFVCFFVLHGCWEGKSPLFKFCMYMREVFGSVFVMGTLIFDGCHIPKRRGSHT